MDSTRIFSDSINKNDGRHYDSDNESSYLLMRSSDSTLAAQERKDLMNRLRRAKSYQQLRTWSEESPTIVVILTIVWLIVRLVSFALQIVCCVQLVSLAWCDMYSNTSRITEDDSCVAQTEPEFFLPRRLGLPPLFFSYLWFGLGSVHDLGFIIIILLSENRVSVETIVRRFLGESSSVGLILEYLILTSWCIWGISHGFDETMVASSQTFECIGYLIKLTFTIVFLLLTLGYLPPVHPHMSLLFKSAMVLSISEHLWLQGYFQAFVLLKFKHFVWNLHNDSLAQAFSLLLLYVGTNLHGQLKNLFLSKVYHPRRNTLCKRSYPPLFSYDE